MEQGLERLAHRAAALTEPADIAERTQPTWPELREDAAMAFEGRIGLLLHDEDLSLAGPVQREQICAVGVLAPARTGRRHASRAVSRFGLAAAADTLTHAAGTPNLDEAPKLLRGIAAARRWSEALQLDTVLVPYAPVGELTSALTQLQQNAGSSQVVFFQRRLDRLAWPHAAAGYFALRKRIPEILEQLAIAPRD